MLTRIANAIDRLYADESGATMVEYALLLALIALVSILVITQVGTRVKGKFQSAGSALT